ncbi:MAG: PEGA domain-containing protein, partial [Muribaculaceae bacterium]
MKSRITLLLSLLMCGMAAVAQSLSVTSFKPLPNDLTANNAGTMVKDQNGEVAALIKVVTTQTGFAFEGGMAGIVKTQQRTGEIWVYVPHGIQKITILHQTLGVLRDYYFPCAIEEARTYEMVLASGEVRTVVTQDAGG